LYSQTVNLSPDIKVLIDSTYVNVLSAEQDCLLSISFLRAENEICFNAWEAVGDRGKEERVLLLGIFQKADATITIHVHKSAFLVLIDGVIVYTFAKRIFKDAKSIFYSCSGPSIFADSLILTTATSGSPNPTSCLLTSSPQMKYFPLTAADVVNESEHAPFDYIIIGSGTGGGVLAADLLEKNKRLTARRSETSLLPTPVKANKCGLRLALGNGDQPAKRILILERGSLLFDSHSLNTPRSPSSGVYSQVNDLLYNQFKREWDVDNETRKIWQGGPVYCLGGRSAVWSLTCHRCVSFLPFVNIASDDCHRSIHDETFRSQFHPSVYHELNETYLRKAEDCMNATCPETLPLHDELVDYLNVCAHESDLPTTQWMWGRVASDSTDQRKQILGYTRGAYSSIDRLLEAAVDSQGRGQFKTVLESAVSHLEPHPVAGKRQSVSHVVVKGASGLEYRIRTKNVVVSAGAVESAAILLRSRDSNAPSHAFGNEFASSFGKVTDHRIFFFTLPFYYRNTECANIDGMELMTDITFANIDNTTALGTISINTSSCVPRQNIPESPLPQLIVAFTLPSALVEDNEVTLNSEREPHLTIGYANDPYLDDKKEVLCDLAVDLMNKLADKLDLQFVQHKSSSSSLISIDRVNRDVVRELRTLGPGAIGHELGSLPMATKTQEGIVDENLKMRHGWDNVYVCDLSVFPYSPAASPSLLLTALALRLSDHLVPIEEPVDPISRVHDRPEQSRASKGADENSR
jgi:choline dehydrogenase-like flavoprotein